MSPNLKKRIKNNVCNVCWYRSNNKTNKVLLNYYFDASIFTTTTKYYNRVEVYQQQQQHTIIYTTKQKRIYSISIIIMMAWVDIKNKEKSKITQSWPCNRSITLFVTRYLVLLLAPRFHRKKSEKNFKKKFQFFF
jgi:hypothetical protein